MAQITAHSFWNSLEIIIKSYHSHAAKKLLYRTSDCREGKGPATEEENKRIKIGESPSVGSNAICICILGHVVQS